jgi:hypothetical protein
MRSKLCLLTGLLILGAAEPVRAVCVQNDAGTAEWAYWDTHGCDWNFVLHADEIHDTRSSDWGNRGYYDACNINNEFTKFWNASHLMHFGLQNSYDWSFHHSTADYVETIVKYDTNFHDDLHHTATDDMSKVARFVWQMWDSNEIRGSCHLYNPNNPLYPWANPAARGGALVHEGWHAWQEQQGVGPGHHWGPQGYCVDAGDVCDYWYWHGISVFAFGDMWVWDLNPPAKLHTTSQAQVEYLCDLADLPQAWVPSTVTSDASASANYFSDRRFINGPAFHCGDWRPW